MQYNHLLPDFSEIQKTQTEQPQCWQAKAEDAMNRIGHLHEEPSVLYFKSNQKQIQSRAFAEKIPFQ